MGGEAFVVMGQITRPHGLNGEVKVRPATGLSERFNEHSRFFIRTQDKSGWFKINQLRKLGPFILMKFEGIESREDAEALRSGIVEIPRESDDLPEGEFYIADLIGLKVRTVSGENVGICENVLQQSAQDLYVIRNEEREILIPAVHEFIKKVDFEAGEIVIDPIEGLLD